MNLLSVPSKTFVIGEYSVLEKGKALLLNTKPRFFLEVKKGSGIEGICKESPAFEWIQNNSKDFSSYHLKFKDPYNGAGGLGASSAQYILVRNWSDSKSSVQKIWQDYKNILEKPSGADVVSQYLSGSWVGFQSDPFQAESLNYPFKNLGFCLLRTGYKLATHKHLEKLKLNNLSKLNQFSQDTFSAFQKKDESSFLKNILRFREALEEKGLVSEKTLALLKKIDSSSLFLASKGCGAMGADTIIAFFHKDKLLDIKSWVLEQDLIWLSSHEDEDKEGLKWE